MTARLGFGLRRGGAAALAGVLLLTGCSGGSEPSETAAPAPTTPPTQSTPTAAPFNPCDDLTAALVGRALGAEVRKETGSSSTLRCAFLPTETGGPTLNVTYLDFDGDFEQAWASMGTIDGTVTDVDVAGARAARLVVNARDDAVLVTGFVQVGGLLQTVNAVQLAPYDESGATAAVTTVLARLAKAELSRS